MKYIKTGYEDHMVYALINMDKTILINGKFGTGKTRILEEVLKREEFKKKKVLKLKMYEEFIEENYITFLYNTILKDEKCFLKRWYNANKQALWSTISSLFLLEGARVLSCYTGLGRVDPTVVIGGVFPLFFFGKLFENKKINMQEYIEKRIEKYDYIILDDLDRVYINHTEVLKLIQFLNEGFACKLILLGDKQLIAKEENNLNMIEKYYDSIFEVPKDKVASGIIGEILNNIQVDENDDLDYLKQIWVKMEPRKLIKIYQKIRMDNEAELYDYIRKLHQGDYLFIVTLLFNNGIYIEELIAFIQQLIDVIWREEVEQIFQYQKGDTEYNKFSKIKKMIDTKDGINDEEKLYLLRSFAYTKGAELPIKLDTELREDTSFKECKFMHRLFDQPQAYKFHSIEPTELSPKKIKESFKKWLIEDDEKANYNAFQIYKREINKEQAIQMVIELLESGEINPYTNFMLIGKDLVGENNQYSLRENVSYWIDYMNNKLADKLIYDKIAELYNLKDWKKFNMDVKLDILVRETYSGSYKFRDILVSQGEEECIALYDQMIKREWVIYLYKVLRNEGIEAVRGKRKIEDAINIMMKQISSWEGNGSYYEASIRDGEILVEKLNSILQKNKKSIS